MDRETELDIIRRAYAKQMMAAAKADAEAGVDAWWNTLAFLKNGVDSRGSL